MTRLDITFSINKLSLCSPIVNHWMARKRMLRYLKGNIGNGFVFRLNTTLTLEGFSCTDWACCPDTRRSTSEYCVYLGGN